MVTGLTVPGRPVAEELPVGGPWLAPCDATASGSEDAQVRLARGRDELFMCAHHFEEHELALLTAGWQVTQDNRGRLS